MEFGTSSGNVELRSLIGDEDNVKDSLVMADIPGQVIISIMGNPLTSNPPDPAAVFAAALSLWHTVKKHAAANPTLNLSECYNGGDQVMRQVMRIATEFEHWSCEHVFFEDINDVWSYLLEDEFGKACISILGGPETLLDFDTRSCLRVAHELRLPVRMDTGLPVAIDVTAKNPARGAAFHKFRIQTVRDSLKDNFVEAFTADDEPFDDEFGAPYFSFYGLGEDDLLEHIADRATYSAAIELACKLAPGIDFKQIRFSQGGH